MRSDRFDSRPAPCWQAWTGAALLVALYGYVGQLDYADARMAECAEQSTASHIHYWDPATDSCKQEQRKPSQPR